MTSFAHSSAYKEDNALRELPRLLAAGTEAMRSAARENRHMWPMSGELRRYYLANEQGSGGSSITPNHSQGQISAYDHRVRTSTLRNVWLDSVQRSALAPMRETITPEGWTAEIDKWSRSMDGSTGKTLSQYMMAVLEDQAVDGIHFTLVDLPRVLSGKGESVTRSLGDDDRAGRRPYCVPLNAADVDPFSIATIGGEVVLLGCGIYLEDTSRTAEATTQEEKTAAWRVYRLAEDDFGSLKVEARDYPLKTPERAAEIDEENIGPWLPVVPLGSSTTLDRIPVVPFYGNFKTGPFRGQPRYLEAAEIQAGAWRKRSEKDENGRQTRDRIFQSGVDLEKDGSPRVQLLGNYLYSTKAESRASGLYPTGAALEALRVDIEDDEEHIRTSTRAITARSTTGQVTATEIGLRGLEAGTYQEATTRGNAASIAQAFRFMEIMGGLTPSGGTVEWQFKSAKLLATESLNRIERLVLEDKLPVSVLLDLERLAGNLPEDFDVEGAVAGVQPDLKIA